MKTLIVAACLVLSACGVSQLARQEAAKDAYTKALVECSDAPENTTALAIDACHERVRREWSVTLDGGSDAL